MGGTLSFDNDQSKALEQANVVTSIISLTGSFFIIFCYFYLKELRTFAFKLVLMMCISDVFYSIGNCLGDAGGGDTHIGSSNGLCTFQSILLSYFGLTSLFWAISIAFTLQKAFLQESEAFGPARIHENTWKYHLICWGIPVIFTLGPLITDSYGDTGGWCWIKPTPYMHVYWKFVQFYIFLWLGIAYNCYVFINVYQKIRNMTGGHMQGNDASAAMARRLKLYPVVLILCHVFGTINAFYEAVNHGEMVYELNMLGVIFGTSMGFFNALVYGLTPEVGNQLCSRRGDPHAMTLDDATI